MRPHRKAVVGNCTDHGVKRNVVTDENGAFTIPGLPIGPYRLEVTLTGFKSYIQTGIVLQVGSAPSIPVTLAIGTVAENVTVMPKKTTATEAG